MIKKPFDVCFQGQRVFAFPPICISASGAAVFALNENLECSIVSPPCLVDGLFTLPCNDRPGPDYLLHLALQSLKSSSAHLALSTRRSYHCCVQKVVELMAKQVVVCFPVITTALAQVGLCQRHRR